MAMNPADYIVEIVNADFTDPAKVDTILNKWTTSTDKASTPATDLLLLLSRGQTAFFGQAAEALPYNERECGLKPGACESSTTIETITKVSHI
jgi:hypothetical protein